MKYFKSLSLMGKMYEVACKICSLVMSNLLSCQICDNMETKFVAIHNPITIFIQTMQQQCVLTGIFLNTVFARPIFIIYTL